MQSLVLSGMKDCYKIKLRQLCYRMVYRVDDDIVSVTVIATGKEIRKKSIKMLIDGISLC